MAGIGAVQTTSRYWPEELVDFDRNRQYRRDAQGFHLCEATIACPNLAIDYSGYCAEHIGSRGAKAISRFDAFRMGALPVEQLEDWELVRGCARQPRGVKPNRHLREVSSASMVPIDQYRAMVAELFKRHDEKLRGMADAAIETLFEIMVNDANEPADRIKAATWIYERVRGKNAETIKLEVGGAEPWQQVIEGVARVTREQAHQEAQKALAIDAEIVPPTDEAGGPRFLPADGACSDPSLRATSRSTVLGDAQGSGQSIQGKSARGSSPGSAARTLRWYRAPP